MAMGKTANIKTVGIFKYGAPRGIRTPDTQVRSLVLYPAELWAQLKLFNLTDTNLQELALRANGALLVREPGRPRARPAHPWTLKPKRDCA